MQLQKKIIYGPVQSRRLGRSLGVNLLPLTAKLCSMNCCYCQYGWTSRWTNTPDAKDGLPPLREIELAIGEVLKSGLTFDYLTFSGNGEPTLHPDFETIVNRVLKMRATLRLDFKLALLSNGTTTPDPQLRKTFARIDLPMMKLDVGNEAAFKRMNHGVPPVRFSDILAGIKSLDRVVIQSMFVAGRVDNSTEAQVDTWIDALREIAPLWVQIYSLDRVAADNALHTVERARLMQIARRAQEATGLQIDVF
ncbi:MAG: radical SAM protein [bacterium]